MHCLFYVQYCMQIILNREGILVLSVICYSFFKNCDRIVGYIFIFLSNKSTRNVR
jgi:hypothetical protein